MNHLSEMIGKALFTTDGRYAGTVKNVCVTADLKKIKGVEYFDESEEEFTLPLSAIKAEGDALIVKSLSLPCKNAVPAPFGIAAFSEKGENLGHVRDFTAESGSISGIVLADGKEISSLRISGIGDALILDLSSEILPVKQKKPSRTRNSVKQEAKTESVQPQEKDKKAETPDIPLRAGGGLLTGKRATTDVSDVRGNIIVKKGTLITPEILRRVAQHNKMFELTLSVLPLFPTR